MPPHWSAPGPPVLIYLMLAPRPHVRATLLSFFALIYAATLAADGCLGVAGTDYG